MNELSRQFLEDAKACLPSRLNKRAEYVESVRRRIEERGGIVKIEDSRVDGDRVLERRYYYANGRLSALRALRMGLESLPPLRQKPFAETKPRATERPARSAVKRGELAVA